MRTCSVCRNEFPLDFFKWKNKTKELRQYTCPPCQKIRSDLWYAKNAERQKARVRINEERYKAELKKIVIDYLKAHPCVDCGESDLVVLDFDHVRGEKTMSICEMTRHKVRPTTLINEIAKCEIRCSNCHRRKTAKERNFRFRLG